MATSSKPQDTDFTHDVLGRYVCNGLDEALKSTDTSLRPDARLFDVIIIGGGSFGPVLAQHLFTADKTRSYRTLVLEAGRFLLSGDASVSCTLQGFRAHRIDANSESPLVFTNRSVPCPRSIAVLGTTLVTGGRVEFSGSAPGFNVLSFAR